MSVNGVNQVVDDDGRGSPGSVDDTERPASTKSADSDYPETTTKVRMKNIKC